MKFTLLAVAAFIFGVYVGETERRNIREEILGAQAIPSPSSVLEEPQPDEQQQPQVAHSWESVEFHPITEHHHHSHKVFVVRPIDQVVGVDEQSASDLANLVY